MKYNVAIIGTGNMARRHCEALAADQHARLHNICSTERSSSAASEMVERYGFVRQTTDYASVLSDPAVDVVFICTPDENHAEYTVRALQAGKHVFCEKPLARSATDFERIGRGLASSGKVLQVGMNCRFREQYSIPKQKVSAGKLGGLRFIRGTYIINVVQGLRRREKPWWTDYPPTVFPLLHGGAIHCLDLIRWIGGKISSVFARSTGFELGEELSADTFTVSLEFAGGALGELLASGAAFRPNDFSLEMWLERGSILGTTVYLREHDQLASAQEKIVVEQRVIDLGLQFQDIVRAIESGQEPLNSFGEAYSNFMVLSSIEQSIREGRAVSVAD
jgi:predicted dehydrogenase